MRQLSSALRMVFRCVRGAGRPSYSQPATASYCLAGAAAKYQAEFFCHWKNRV